MIHTNSSKQKLNKKSSAESELVGVRNYLKYTIWLHMFLKETYYDLRDNIIFQDNQSEIRMDWNGRNSFTGNSGHVQTRYLFVKDKVYKKEIKME